VVQRHGRGERFEQSEAGKRNGVNFGENKKGLRVCAKGGNEER